MDGALQLAASSPVALSSVLPYRGRYPSWYVSTSMRPLGSIVVSRSPRRENMDDGIVEAVHQPVAQCGCFVAAMAMVSESLRSDGSARSSETVTATFYVCVLFLSR